MHFCFKHEATHRWSRWPRSPRGPLAALQRVDRPTSVTDVSTLGLWIRHSETDMTCYFVSLAKSCSAQLFPSLGELLNHRKAKCLSPQVFRSSSFHPQGQNLFLDGARQPGDKVLGFECNWENSPHLGVQSRLPASGGGSGTQLSGADLHPTTFIFGEPEGTSTYFN